LRPIQKKKSKASGNNKRDAKAARTAKAVAALDTGLSPMAQTIQQLKGIVLVGGVVFGLSLALWFVIKLIFGVRVSEEEESEGLDVGEHGNVAYPNFSPSSHH
jgi:Amt family ammonium transporter